ncbi:MAG: tRNA-dihydrouridine synthase family protein [Salinivirgaceae bacterium]|jgi:tRNA-dihydrouridine synthase|nr:tRNA-dihydrouridine synthase family protein [Salinivirgaceae bacterium]
MIISLAPLQGYTEYPFRNALNNIIGGVDKFYSPFLRFENDGTIRKKHLADIAPENNNGLNFVPQILVNNSLDFLKLAQIVADYGYSELNWNLGCPYPMVAKRKLGSGLLAFPEQIHQILSDAIPNTPLKISVKLRSGYTSEEEIGEVLKVLNQFPLSEVIYHPRIGKQLYKGVAKVEKFERVRQECINKIVFNGDINSISKIQELKQRFHEIEHFMIGRALISNPFLGAEIKQNTVLSESLKRKQFKEFYNELFSHYSGVLSGNSHLLNKFIHFWEYFCQLFVDSRKVYKTIKKCQSVDKLHQATTYFMQNNEFV